MSKSKDKSGRNFDAERAQAYIALEEPLCDCINMGLAAACLASAGERDLAEFMLYQLEPLLQDLRKRYLAKGFAE